MMLRLTDDFIDVIVAATIRKMNRLAAQEDGWPREVIQQRRRQSSDRQVFVSWRQRPGRPGQLLHGGVELVDHMFGARAAPGNSSTASVTTYDSGHREAPE